MGQARRYVLLSTTVDLVQLNHGDTVTVRGEGSTLSSRVLGTVGADVNGPVNGPAVLGSYISDSATGYTFALGPLGRDQRCPAAFPAPPLPALLGGPWARCSDDRRMGQFQPRSEPQ